MKRLVSARSRRRLLAGLPTLGRASTATTNRIGSKVCVPAGDTDNVCLNEHQQAVLQIDPSPSSRLGCGSYACVFPRKGTARRVVKITSDPDDVAGLLALQGHPGVVKVHAAYRLRSPSGGVSKNYAVIVDRLWEPSENAKGWLNEINDKFGRGAAAGALWTARKSPRFGSKSYRLADPDRLRRWCDDQSPSKRGKCRQVVDTVIAVHEAGARKGVHINDVHGGNWMMHQGRLVLADAGVSKAPSRTVPLLGRARRR